MDDKMRLSLGKKVSNTALIINITLMLSKAAVGIVSRSTAILADAFNNGTDIFATIVVFGGLRIAYLPPDEKHHYGHAKAESVVSKIVAIIIGITGVTIGWSSIQQIISGKSEIPGSLAIIISIASIMIKYFLYRYTNRVGNSIGSSAIIADSFNHRTDVLASFSAMVGVLGARMGYPILDPVAGLVVSVLIVKTGISIYMEAIDALMDTAPEQETVDCIKSNALCTDGVISVNDIRARKHGARLRIDLKICVDAGITVEEGHNIAADTKTNIINHMENIEDIMVHVNPCSNLDKEMKPQCHKCKSKK